MTQTDVIIIGAGIGGLCAGALLAKEGKNVLILERESHVGGRACSMTYKGHDIDYGAHTPALLGYLEEVFSRLGKPFPEMIHCFKKLEVYTEGEFKDISKLYPHPEMRKIVGEIIASSYEELAKYDYMSLKDWVSTKTDNEGVHLWFWYQGMLMCVGSRYEPISAGEYLRITKETMERISNFKESIGVMKGGFSKLSDPLAEAVKENGGEIRTGVRVLDTVIEGGRVRGVRVDSGERLMPGHLADTEEIHAPVVICTVPIWDLFKVVSSKHFPDWTVEWVDEIKHKVSSIWSLVVSTDKPLWEEGTSLWVPELPRTKLGAIFTHFPTYSHVEGQYNASFFAQGNYDEVPNLFDAGNAETRNAIECVFDNFEKDVDDLFPDLKDHCLWRFRHAVPYNIAATPGLVGRGRPGMRFPEIENFYLLTDTLHRVPGGVGTQAMANLAMGCVDEILGKQ